MTLWYYIESKQTNIVGILCNKYVETLFEFQ